MKKTKKEALYKPDQTIIKVYGYGDHKKIKVVTMNILRTAGLDVENLSTSIRGTVNENKLNENIIRAKNKIFELAFCNPWQYFFTGTLNKEFYDRTNLEKFHKDFTQFIRDKSKKYNCGKIDFLLIPEKHSDGISWHMHGFINGLPPEALSQFKIGDIMGKSLAEKVCRGDFLFHWLDYDKKFGFNDLEPIKNPEAVSKYITKYINKSLYNSVTELNAQLYYHSRGLREAETIKKGSMDGLTIEPNFSNEYCSVAWLDYSEEKLNELQNSIIKTLS